MLPAQRQQAILAQVRAQGAASAVELSRRLGVSAETVRRDLRALRDQGLLNRVHGGATAAARLSGETSFAARATLNLAAKQAIAALAAALVGDEETIVIDTGTTALALARALPASFRGRVLTNSVPVAAELSARRDIELLLAGGEIRPGDGACFGTQAEAFFAGFYPAKAFLGAGGVHPEAGLTDYYPAEVAIRQTILSRSAQTYVLADASKLGVIAPCLLCPLDQLTAVITDDDRSPAPPGVTLLRADSSDPEPG
jgi:DeoR family fructose operon transcriptional repressor